MKKDFKKKKPSIETDNQNLIRTLKEMPNTVKKKARVAKEKEKIRKNFLKAKKEIFGSSFCPSDFDSTFKDSAAPKEGSLTLQRGPMQTPNNLLPKDGDVRLYPAVFDEPKADRLFEALTEEIAWKQEPIRIFGKMVLQPRLTAWYGDEGRSYSYSGITMTPMSWTPSLLEIKARVEDIFGMSFNSALLNLYRDEKDSVGWHRDNEKELGPNPTIASVSFGVTREFQFRHGTEKNLRVTLPLPHGSVLLMSGETQHHWHHAIPKKRTSLGPRINITFRSLR